MTIPTELAEYDLLHSTLVAVLPQEYRSTLGGVPQYFGQSTGVIQARVLQYSVLSTGLIIPVGVLLITLERHLFHYTYLLQGVQNYPLLLGSEGSIASTALVIGVAPELAYEYHRKAVVLVGEHPLLEVGEAAGVRDGLVAAEELALGILAALCGVHHTQNIFLLNSATL